MRTRTRQMVRMLADIRHAAHCRVLRAQATQEAMRLAAEEAEADAASHESLRKALEAASALGSIESVKH